VLHSIHAVSDFNKDETIMDKIQQCVLVDYRLRKGCDDDVHVLFQTRGCAKIEVFQVGGGKVRSVSGDDAFEDNFDLHMSDVGVLTRP
jgi:hypothetical protein